MYRRGGGKFYTHFEQFWSRRRLKFGIKKKENSESASKFGLEQIENVTIGNETNNGWLEVIVDFDIIRSLFSNIKFSSSSIAVKQATFPCFSGITFRFGTIYVLDQLTPSNGKD